MPAQVEANKVLTRKTLTCFLRSGSPYTGEYWFCAEVQRPFRINNGDGKHSFPKMNYTEKDAGQTYTHLLYEEIPTEKLQKAILTMRRFTM